MRGSKFKKTIVGFLITGEILIFPLFALAQAVPTCDPNNGDTCAAGYIAGIAANAGAEAALKGEYGVYKSTCFVPLETFEQSNKVAQLGFSGLSMIGGNSVLLVQFQAEIEAYNLFLICAKAHQVTLTGLPAGNNFLSNIKQTMLNEMAASINAYTTKLAQSQAKANNAKQGFWKTLVFNILIKTSKAVANSLVQKLVSNYKVNNIKQYTDSVATLMYDNQFLRDNFHGAQGQLMARAILENPSLRYKVQPGIFIAADAALGFDPKALNTNDPDFYTKMSQVGSSVANPYFQQSQYIGGVDQARANSLAYAQGQIQQGNGYKAPVTCAGSLAQQQAIDGQTKSASDRLDNRQNLLVDLVEAKKLGKPVKDSDIRQAQADYDAALSSWRNLPATVTGSNKDAGGGGGAEGKAAITICEAISSPANLINKGIDEAFKSVGTKLGQYNENNLPGFMNIIADVSSQIGSSLIFGGTKGAKSALLINEGRLANAAIGAATDKLYSNASENLAKGIEFNVEEDLNSDDGYVLSWDVVDVADKVKGANFVTIQGNGISTTIVDPATNQTRPNKLPLSGRTIIHTTVGGDYILYVFDANGRALTASASVHITPSTSLQVFNSSSGRPAVAGAFTDKPMFNVRGPAVQISARGE